jgi:hypothetical protein
MTNLIFAGIASASRKSSYHASGFGSALCSSADTAAARTCLCSATLCG